MKKLLLFLAFFIIGSFGAVQAGARQKGPELDGKGYLAIAGVTAAYALGVKIATGEVDSDDLRCSLVMAMMSTYGACLFKDGDKKTGVACVVVANVMMCAYTCATIAIRPRPAPGGLAPRRPAPGGLVPRRLILEVEETHDCFSAKDSECNHE